MTETQFLEKINAGDRSAFNELVKAHQNFVLNTCYRFFGNSDDARDATQEIFIKIYFSIQHYKPKAKLSTWIYRITVNYCLNMQRSKKRRRWLINATELFTRENQSLEMLVNSADNPETELQEKEKQKIIQSALNKLNDDQRTAIILHRFQGQSYKEIAEIMQISVSAVESRIFRAKQQLAKYLKSYMN